MNESRFFRFVWRLNGLLILALCVLGLGSLLRDRVRDWRRDFTTSPEAVREREAAAVAQPGLGELEMVADGRWLAFPYTSMGMGGRRGERMGEVTLDLLLLDTATNTSQWLVEDPEATVESWWAFVDDYEVPLVGYVVKRADGSEDQLVADLLRGTKAVVVRGVSDRVRFERTGDRLFCLYNTDAGLMSAVFALDQGMACLDRRLVPQRPGGAVGP